VPSRRAIDTAVGHWEAEFDGLVELGRDRRLEAALSGIRRLRGWQRRHVRYGGMDWHEAELLWLEGVILTRSRRTKFAEAVWTQLARLFEQNRSEAWLLPACTRCRERRLPFAPSWFETAVRLKVCPSPALAARLAEAATVPPPDTSGLAP
jgi:hypothetical protein